MRFYLPDLCGYGLSFELDGFRVVFVAVAVFAWLFALALSCDYMKHETHRVRYYLFTVVTLAATVGVFLSADFFTAFIFFEIMSFTSYTWVAQTEKTEALRAADTYLAVAVIGGLAMLMGMFLLYHMFGTLDFEELGRRTAEIAPTPMYYAAGVCILTGFGAKAGVFPLHIWLPKAYFRCDRTHGTDVCGGFGVGQTDSDSRCLHNACGRGAGSVCAGSETHPCVLFGFADRLYHDGHRYVRAAVWRACTGGTRSDAAHDQSFADQACVVFVGRCDLYTDAPAGSE